MVAVEVTVVDFVPTTPSMKGRPETYSITQDMRNQLKVKMRPNPRPGRGRKCWDVVGRIERGGDGDEV